MIKSNKSELLLTHAHALMYEPTHGNEHTQKKEGGKEEEEEEEQISNHYNPN